MAMYWRYIHKVILCLLFIGMWTQTHAGEYRDSTLWVEVLVSSGHDVSIKGQYGARQTYTIQMEDSPLSCELVGDLKITLMNPDTTSYWGFLDRVEVYNEDSVGEDDVVLRSYPVWENGRLKYVRERLLFSSESFTSRDDAQQYARDNNISIKSIQEIPVSGGTVRITQNDGQVFFFEAPLRISTDSKINMGSGGFDYTGAFVLKVVKDRLVLNHFLPLDEYIAGVIQNEIGNNAPSEALKAQAVAARTHAVSLLLYNRHSSDGYDLCNGTHCQVYKGSYLSNPSVRNAVFETAGVILVFNNKAIDATYHSCCGGKTDASSLIWKGTPVPYLMGITCDAEADTLDLRNEADARYWLSKNGNDDNLSSWERYAKSWKRELSLATLANNAGTSKIKSILIEKRGYSGRITRISLFGKQRVVLDNESSIRKAFGGLPSSFFYIQGKYTIEGDGVRIKPASVMKIIGKGSGHGVGMCQVGALQMARSGFLYQDILSKYYPGTSLKTDWMNYE